jgi:CRP/FNR family transcriptional regulator, polysaccharide utilization system transcription regulator
MRSVIGAKYYSINSQAIEDTIACFFSTDTFFNLISRYPQLSKCLLLFLSNQLNDAEDKMTSLAHKPVRERLAEAILNIADKFSSNDSNEGNTINLSREDLAKMIGSATETVIRLLSEFKEENLIRINGRKIIILNVMELKRVANIPITADLTLSFYKEPSEYTKNGSLSIG